MTAKESERFGQTEHTSNEETKRNSTNLQKYNIFECLLRRTQCLLLSSVLDSHISSPAVLMADKSAFVPVDTSGDTSKTNDLDLDLDSDFFGDKGSGSKATPQPTPKSASSSTLSPAKAKSSSAPTSASAALPVTSSNSVTTAKAKIEYKKPSTYKKTYAHKK